MTQRTVTTSLFSRYFSPAFGAALAFAVALAAFAPAPAEAQQYVNEQLGVNLGNVNARGMHFVDIGLVSDRYFALGTREDPAADADGWPTEDFRWVAFDLRPCCWFGIPSRGPEAVDDPQGYEPPAAFGTYDFAFTGQADVVSPSGSATVSELTYDEATNTTRGTVTLTDDDIPDGDPTADETDPGEALLNLDFSNTRRTPGAEVGSGVTDIHLLRPGFSLDEDYPTFYPAFTDALAPFDKVRYMSGWQETNPKGSFAGGDQSQPTFTEWSQRKLPSDASQRGPSPGVEVYGPPTDEYYAAGGVAYEYIIQLSNETQTDPWINVPISASDDYIQNLADLFASELDPGLSVYVEYANEIWNPAFKTQTWNIGRATEELQNNPDDIINYDGTACNDEACNDVVYQVAAQRHAAKRTVVISQAFEDAFSDDSRVKVDLSWFALFTTPERSAVDNTRNMLQFIADTYEGEVSDYVDEISVTGYYGFGEDPPPGLSEQEVLDILGGNIPTYYDTFDALADEYGLDLAVYEGGDNTSRGGGGSTNSVGARIRAARDQQMGDLVRENILNTFYPDGGDLYMYFTLTNPYSRFGTWGATDDINNLDRDFQYEALVDVASQQPPEENDRPIASFTATPTAGPAPLEVSFDASASSDADGSIASYEWDFGDGETGSGETVTHTYTADGRYTATLTVTDDDAATSSSSVEVIVGDAGRVLAADPFNASFPPGSQQNLPLEGQGTGSGWAVPWDVQGDNTDVPGFNIAPGEALSFGALETSEGYAVGGQSFLTATRRLDRSEGGPFANYYTGENDFIGAPGTTLWLSALVRNDEGEYKLCVSTAFRPLNCNDAKVGFGVYPDASDGEWSLRTGGEGGDVVPSGVSAEDGETALAVIKVEFGESESNASLYMNPDLSTGEPPAEADAQATVSNSLAFYSVGWKPGNQPGQGALDEIRFGETYAAVTPGGDDGGDGGGGTTLEPLADAEVKSPSPDDNFGSTEDMSVISSSPSYGPGYSYVKFDVSSLDGDPSGATLRLLAYEDDGGTIGVVARQVIDDSWEEDAITFNNRPEAGPEIATTVVEQDSAYYEWDVSSFVQSEAAGDGTVSFYLARSSDAPGSAGGGEVLDFSTKEGPSAPQLVVEGTGGGGDGEPPVADFTAEPDSGAAPLEVTFDASASSDADGSIESYAWAFGDGESGEGETVTHTYAEAGTYTAELTVTDDAGNTATATQEISVGEGGGLPQATVAAAASAPAIDGAVDDVWAGAAFNPIENVISGTVSSENDLSGSWKALWDESSLYYLVEITDDSTSSDDEGPYDDDSPEIYIDAENDGNSSRDDAPPLCEYGENDFQFTFDPETGEVLTGFCSVADTTGIDFTVTDTEAGYRLEAAIPWSTLGVEPASGTTVGTDVHANDDDDGGARDAKIAWADTEDRAFAEPSVFGDATLSGEPGGGALAVAPRDTTVNAGETFLLPIDVSGTADPTVDSYQFTLNYDASLLEATGVVVEGTASAGAAGEQNINAEAGTVKFAAAADGQDSDGLLAPPPTQETPLVYVEFETLDATAGQAAEVSFSEFLFNEGEPAVETAPGTVEIGEVLYGDVSGDGQVTALDASQVLQAVVDLIALSSEQRTRADVSGNGTVAALDAALILDFVSGAIDTFPVENQDPQNAALAAARQGNRAQSRTAGASGAQSNAEARNALHWGEVRTAADGATRLLPLQLEGPARPVRAVELVAEFDSERVTVEDVATDRLPQGWVAYHNTTEDGRLKVALAGTGTLPEGEVLTVRLRLKDASTGGHSASEKAPAVTGRVRLNEALMRSMKDVSVVNLPSEFTLVGNAPNPFRSRTEIGLDLPANADVTVEVYDMIGRRVKQVRQSLSAGAGQTVRLEAGALSSGVYLYRVIAETEDGERLTDTGRMVVVK